MERKERRERRREKVLCVVGVDLNMICSFSLTVSLGAKVCNRWYRFVGCGGWEIERGKW